MQLGLWGFFSQKQVEAFPHFFGEIFGCGIDALHPRDVEVQVLMINFGDDALADDFLELAQIQNHPGFRIHRTGNGDVQTIIVAMTVGVRA